jgi:hypothetical protein
MKKALIGLLILVTSMARAEDPTRPDPRLTPGDVLPGVTVEQIF